MQKVLIATALLCVVAAAVVAATPSNQFPYKGATGYFSPRRSHLPNKFDYIVIGGGTAGCAVAARLSENPDNKVLLLERGSDTSNQLFLDVPRNWDKVTVSVADQFTMIDWRQEPVVSWNEVKARVSTGIGLGGTSLINSEMFVRGHADDYNRWATNYGATGWSYNDVLPYFKKLENNPSKYAMNPAYHGIGGPLTVTPGTVAAANDAILIQAAAEYGIPFNPDHNGANQLTSALGGIAYHDMTVANGTRVSSYKSYIVPNLGRSNLYVVDSAYVTKINFKTKKSKITATSVEWYDALEKTAQTTRVDSEIILSSGGIGTPKLLQISGIGDAAHLESLGIEVVKHLPGVGQNLQDHPITNLAVDSTGVPDGTENAATPAAYQQWLTDRTGAYSSIGGRMITFFRTSHQNASNDPRPNIEVIGGTPGSGIFGAVYLLLPKSRGYVKIHTANPFVDPLPVGNFFSHPEDLPALCEGLHMLYGVWTKINPNVHVNTGPAGFPNEAPGACASWISGFAPWTIGNSNTGSHWSGTAQIGPVSNPMAVVDPRLKVHGIENLRVADASVFPEIPSANTQATTYMVAEKAAAMILEDNA